jgi:tetratricopeptide (TPR) repeat protein
VTINSGVPTPPKAERTLPTDVPGFVGRHNELERLLAAVTDAADEQARAVSIHAVDGMAGVGKTAFAVHAAHRLAARFPDGQLFVALRAHAPGQARVEPAAALETLLQADGVAAQRIPVGLDARAGLWRDRMADKKLLLVLDDAADTMHVAPLLPGAPGCLVLITSRRKLTTLPGATVLSLDTLPPDQAAQLFVQRAGRRGHDDPATVERIIGLCGYLPLAITLTAARLHTHPTWTVADLAADLDETRDRLAELASGELAVAAAFDLSYRDLTAIRQRLFRRLALHPGPDLDAYAAAALDHNSLTAARRGLEDLLEHNLITEPHRGRYRFHDLIAEHARTLAADDSPAEQETALDRLLGYYLHTATTAARHLARRTPPTGATPVISALAEAPALANPQQATDWLTREQPNLAAAAGWAATHHRTPAAVGIPAALHDHLLAHGPWTLARDLHHTALTAAQHANDHPGQALTLTNLAAAQQLTGDYTTAAVNSGQALDLYQRLGDRLGQANVLDILGRVQYLTGDYPAAATTAGQALDLSRQLGDRLGQINALDNLGHVQRQAADYVAAATTAGRALDLSRQLGDRLGQANALYILSIVQYLTDDYAAAATTAGQALDHYQRLGDRFGQANALNILGMVQCITGDYPAAATTAGQALDLSRQLGDQLSQGDALDTLGTVQYMTGDYTAASTTLGQALDLSRQSGNPLGQANALLTLGIVQYQAGDYAAAATTTGQSLDLYQRLGDRVGQANALNTLGRVQHQTGEHEAAATTTGQALDLFQQLDDRHGQANAMQTLGRVQHQTGENEAAAITLGQTLDLFRDLGDDDGQAETLNHIGELLLASSTAAAAHQQFTAALGLARNIGAPPHEARALEGIGDCALREGRRNEGVTHLQEALAIYRRINSPNTTRVEAALRRENR